MTRSINSICLCLFAEFHQVNDNMLLQPRSDGKTNIHHGLGALLDLEFKKLFELVSNRVQISLRQEFKLPSADLKL